MKIRSLLALTLAVSAAACSQHPDSSLTARDASRASRAPAGPAVSASQARLASLATAHRFGSVPDRGSLVAFPRAPVVRHDGAYTWFRADVSEAHARDAIGGVLSLASPSGEQLRFNYSHHVEHPNGDWTWIGKAVGDASREAIITFGAKAAFGSIGQPGKEPLRLTLRDGVSWLVETDPKLIAGINNSATRPSSPDFFVAPDIASAVAHRKAAMVALTSGATSGINAFGALTANATTVDLVLGYTPGLVTALGGESQANTRLFYLVDVSNQAYINSQVDAQVRLVRTVLVNYPDATDNGNALEELTGFKAPSTRTTPSAAFSALRAARDQYGGDLVSIVRKFNEAKNGGCGIAWLIGGGQSGIDRTDEYFGYSVVSDGTDTGADGKTYFCRDETLAHEMGHNEGSAHDRATAIGTDGILQANEYGAYPYSFGYKTDAASGNFYTIMAYGDRGQSNYRVFSDPRVTICGGFACGVDNQADVSRSLVQSIPVIATFRASVVPADPTPPPVTPPPPTPPPTNPPTPPPPPTPPTPPPGPVSVHPAPYDANNDGKSDLFFRGGTALAFWAMNGTTRTFDSYLGNAGDGWKFIAFGDFDAFGGTDVLWANGTQMKIWFNNGNGSYVVYQIGSYGNGFQPIAAADVNGDGKSDILLASGTALAYWTMDGARVAGNAYAGDGGAGYRFITSGDFNGDGADEVVWANGSQIKMWVNGKTSGYTPYIVGSYGNGYTPFAAGYVNADNGLDLLFRGTTAIAYWQLNGSTKVSDAYLGDIGAGYRAFAVGDYNGDGYSDIGLHNGATLKFWMNNAGAGFTSTAVGPYNCCWVPEGGY